MFTNEFEFRILSLEETVFDGMVVSASVLTHTGQITILKKHTPMITPIVKGDITVRTKDGNIQVFKTGKGALIVQATGNTNVLLYGI